ncbi:MAG: hypothetical protein Q8O99_07390 [bacterium]|nr:hypothetical protein [bacterium]
MPTSGINLIVEGSLLGKGMYVVAGDINFAAAGCDDTDIVEGIFLTKGSFTTDRIRNDDLTSSSRCRGGNLNIK